MIGLAARERRQRGDPARGNRRGIVLSKRVVRCSSQNRSRGVVLLKTLLLVPVVLTVLVAGWFFYVEHRRQYWDDKAKALCAKEGGVQVFERVLLQDRRYVDKDGNIRIPVQLGAAPGGSLLPFAAKVGDLFVVRDTLTVIRAEDPRVVRTDVSLVRTADDKVLGTLTSFLRVGGDFVVIDAESRFRCPADLDVNELSRQVFLIDIQPKGER
ncbi:MAG: hypothetical protein HS128_12430 [Ideonella sp.]|nr:hypothetical protein [Ideonella sp.]